MEGGSYKRENLANNLRERCAVEQLDMEIWGSSHPSTPFGWDLLCRLTIPDLENPWEGGYGSYKRDNLAKKLGEKGAVVQLVWTSLHILLCRLTRPDPENLF